MTELRASAGRATATAAALGGRGALVLVELGEPHAGHAGRRGDGH